MTAKLWWMIHKDLASEWRARRAWPAMLLLGIVVALMFALQMGLSPERKQETVGSLLWLAVFFAGMLAMDRSFAAEREEGCWEALLSYPVPPTAVYFAKLAVNVVALAAVECVLVPLFVVLGDGYCYLAGGNRHGMHYPGPRVQLTPAEPRATVELKVYDAVGGPSPLVLRKCEITLQPEAGALRVTERLAIDNPSAACYVGDAAGDGDEPVTLQLAIPPGFERTTFDEEFYGRRFAVKNRKLTTGIPWPPGERVLQYTYVLRNDAGHRRWERPLDLPCDEVVVRVRSGTPGEVACDLPPADAEKEGELVHRSAGPLPAGHVLGVTLGRVPVPWTTYARWAAVGMLLAAVAASGVALLRREQAPGVSPEIPLSDGSIPGLTPGARHLGARHRRSASRRRN